MSKPSLTDIKSVLNPINSAKGLPNAHYISHDVFDEEKKVILFDNWAALDVGKNVPESGDAKPIQFMGIPLLIIRDHDGSIGVFQNSCRHRGMILIDQPKKVRGIISCPYHGWCYGTNGDLRSTPNVGGVGIHEHEDINQNELGLFSIRSNVWNDIIFINISGDAPEFEEYASDLIERWKEFDQEIFHGGESSSYSLDVHTNWKLIVENYSESYHLPYIHPDLSIYSRIEDHYNIVDSETYSGQGTTVYQQIKDESGETLPDYKNISDKWNEGAEYVTLFPNVLLGIHRDHFFSIILEPIDVNHTIEHVELYYPVNLQGSTKYKDIVDENAKRWKVVFSEDVAVVEGMQKSRYGHLFDGGRFSPVLDNATHSFHNWVAKKIQYARDNSE